MKNGKIIFIATLLLVSLVCLSAVSAADDTASDIVTDANDETVLEESIGDAVIEDGQDDELGETDENTLSENSDTTSINANDGDDSLGSEAIGSFIDLDSLVQSKDEMNLSFDFYYDSSRDGPELQQGVKVTKNCIINGYGHTISGEHVARIFDVTNGGSLTLKNLKLVNGFSEWGGAINVYDGSSLTLINCTFSNNDANLVGTPEGGIHTPEGGAVYVKYNSICNITDSRFESNTAATAGGAIYGCYDSLINIYNSTFTNNGVIEDYTDYYDWCGGDAICIYSNTNLVINKSTFDSNNAGNANLATIKVSGSSLTATDSTFSNNYGDYGGAMNGGTAINCTFTGNSANYGGAIYGGSAIDCTFTGNYAYVNGGALANANAEKCTFCENHAYDGNGGAAFNTVAKNCKFTNNNARYGGAMASSEAVKCTFTANSAAYGGAISEGSAVDSTFTENHAETRGGAIYHGTAENCNFTKNEVDYLGGAIYGGSALKCIFADNKADAYGGAISGDIETKEPCSAVNCTFTNNCGWAGGALYFGDAINCTFNGNHVTDPYGSAGNGGAMCGYWDDNNSPCTAINCKFTNNSADGRNAIYKGIADTCVFNGETYGDDVTILQPILNAANFISTYNDGSELVVNITTSTGMPMTNAKIKVDVYKTTGEFVGTYNVSSGGWKVPLNAGSYIAYYNATDFDIENAEGMIVVNKAKSTVTSKAVTAVYNNNKYLVITLKDNNGKALSGVYVTVTLSSAKKYKTDKNGQIKVNVGKLVPKTYTAKISFAGNANYLASSTTAKVVVKKATPKMTAKAKTFKVKVKTKKYTITLKTNKNKVMKKVKVTLKVNKKTFKATTNSKGVATFKITNLKKKGKYTATIKFAGNKYYKALSKKAKITVKK